MARSLSDDSRDLMPQSPYAALLAGQDLADNAGTSSPTNDVAVGFQSSMGALAIGASAWAGDEANRTIRFQLGATANQYADSWT